MVQDNPANANGFSFSVVVVTHGTNARFNTSFELLVKQKVGLRSQIQIIVVNTGSPGGTKDIAQQWFQKHPDDGLFLEMPGAKMAAARNRGIKEARGQWLAFFDADTLINTTYFQEFSNFLETSEYSGPILCGNWLRYNEANGHVTGNHEQAFNCDNSGIVDLKLNPQYFISSSAACLFRTSALQATGANFIERVPPSFSGAHFANSLLLAEGSFSIGFVREAHYLQSYQGTKTGREQKIWNDPAHYREQLMFGYNDLAQQYQRRMGHLPDFMQNLLISGMRDYMLRMLDNNIPCELTAQQQKEFFELTRLILRHVDARNVLLSSLPNLDLKIRIAIWGAFAGNRFSEMPFVLQEISPDRKEALLIHWSTHESRYALLQDSNPEPIVWEKRHTWTFNSHILCHEYRCWIPLTDIVHRRMEVDGAQVPVLCRSDLLETMERNEVQQRFYIQPHQCPPQIRDRLALAASEPPEHFRDAWLFMDKVDKADDNAEHFCRWTMREHPDQPVYFVIDHKSKDWPRLKKDGLPLLAYKSTEHLQALAGAQWLISSHVDKEVTDPLETRDDFGKPTYKVAFLQHGITKYNVSKWLNNYSINCFVSSAKLEYESILTGEYKFTQRELTLAGMPRHDTLLHKARSSRKGKIILICPTWREPLMRTSIQGMSLKEKHSFFQKSDFFKAWEKVTASPTLSKLAADHGCRLLFLPHPEAALFIPLFRMSERCSAISWHDIQSVQDLLVASAMVITDYSSLVFDAAYINKPVAYYQFPEYPDFNTCQDRGKTFYDDAKHGFGPVVSSAQELEDWIADTLRENCVPQERYTKRADDFFTLRDGNNCRRVYEAILSRT